jgi:competence protein ComEC
MGFAWAAGRGTGWKLPPALTLHGALLAWLLAHPAAGCEPGFLLAWLALVGLVWACEPLAGLCSPLLGRAALPFARVLAPWLSTLPLLALLHGGAPLWGVPANLLLLPLVALLAPACLALTLLPVPGAVPVLGGLIGWAGQRLVPAFARIVPLATGRLWPWIALLLGWILLAQLHAGMRRTRWLCAALAAASLGLLAAGGVGRAPPALSVEAVDIGQGDALLLRVPGGDATLVDTGPDPASARRIARVLSRRGVREPVHLVLTHPHLDHAGGWATLARLWPLASTARPAGPAQPWARYGPAGAGAGAGLLRRGQGWTRGEAAFSVRWPPGPLAVRDYNMASGVLRVRWRDREVWLMGDALSIQERDLLALGDPGEGGWHRLLKAGHHGSRGASDPAWVAALRPDLALVSAGRRNAFDHPHAEAMAALRSAGARVYVTGARLGVRVTADRDGWLVETGDGQSLWFPATGPGA